MHTMSSGEDTVSLARKASELERYTRVEGMAMISGTDLPNLEHPATQGCFIWLCCLYIAIGRFIVGKHGIAGLRGISSTLPRPDIV